MLCTHNLLRLYLMVVKCLNVCYINIVYKLKRDNIFLFDIYKDKQESYMYILCFIYKAISYQLNINYNGICAIIFKSAG